MSNQLAQSADPWTILEEHCDAALALSKDLHGRLQDGADAVSLVSLLEQERTAIDAVRDQIQRLTDLPKEAGAGQRRDNVATRLQELIDLDAVSHGLMSRRGVRLSAPRGRRAGVARR